jgi:hypothetical protein
MTELAEGSDVIEGRDQEGPHYHLGMDGGTAIVWAIKALQRLYQLCEVELLIDLDEYVVGIQKVPQALSGELKQGGISPYTVQGL